MATADLLAFLDDDDPATPYLETALKANELRQQYGGHWGEHPKYSAATWGYEANNNDTRLGYWEWVFSQIEADDEHDQVIDPG